MFTPKKLALQVSKKTFLYKYLLFPLGFKQAKYIFGWITYTEISTFYCILFKHISHLPRCTGDGGERHGPGHIERDRGGYFQKIQ
jgi:hypothetical protein